MGTIQSLMWTNKACIHIVAALVALLQFHRWGLGTKEEAVALGTGFHHVDQFQERKPQWDHGLDQPHRWR